MADDNDKEIWFKRHEYGFGWSPSTWQGWVVTGIYVVLVLTFASTLDPAATPQDVAFTFLMPILLLTVGFIRFCYAYGESPRWQWGTDR